MIWVYYVTRHRPTLTPEGQVLYGKAKSILSRSDEFTSIARHFSKGAETEVSIALGAIAQVEEVLEVIKQISEKGVRLDSYAYQLRVRKRCQA